MSDDGNDVFDVCCGERFRGGICVHEFVEDGDGVLAVRADEEGNGD